MCVGGGGCKKKSQQVRGKIIRAGQGGSAGIGRETNTDHIKDKTLLVLPPWLAKLEHIVGVQPRLGTQNFVRRGRTKSCEKVVVKNSFKGGDNFVTDRG